MKEPFSLAYWEGALEAARRECGEAELALGVPAGTTRISSRLDQFEALLDRARQLEDALHRINLCSQSSMGSKHECGVIARRALGQPPGRELTAQQ